MGCTIPIHIRPPLSRLLPPAVDAADLELSAVSTPLAADAWAAALHNHPDTAFAAYIINGLQQGFRVGFNRASPLKAATKNMSSALSHPSVISDYLAKELSLGRLLGPFSGLSQFPGLHVSRFGVIPKGHNTGKWCLITDLSFPPGASANDGIDPLLCSLSYTTVDQVAKVILQLGRHALLAKVDIESAYRLILVHPQDCLLQAVEWRGQLFVDPMLLFGLRSAPKIFNAVADALEWYLHQRGIPHVMHYLDDFIIIGPPKSPQCQHSITILNRVCGELGIPLADHKRDGPTTCLVFVGIEIDTTAGTLRLPTYKLTRLRLLLDQWGERRACRRKELESLVSLLNHACKVVRAGRSFLRRMIDLLHDPPRNSYQAVVACLRSKTSKHKGIMHLLRTLVFVEAHFHFQFVPTYINTHANHLADALSRNDHLSFLSKVPQAHNHHSPIPQDLLNLVMDPRADWTSQLWRRLFNDTLSSFNP